MIHSPLYIAEQGEQKKEGRETGQPLDDIGYRLGLDGVNQPDEASQESYLRAFSLPSPSSFEGRVRMLQERRKKMRPFKT